MSARVLILSTCTAPPSHSDVVRFSSSRSPTTTPPPANSAGQGLTLVHFSAQRKRFLWDRLQLWVAHGVCRKYNGYEGVFRVTFQSETAQVELKVDERKPLPRGRRTSSCPCADAPQRGRPRTPCCSGACWI